MYTSSAVAVHVGEESEPSLQVYLRRDRPSQPLEVVVGTTDWNPNLPDLNNVSISMQGEVAQTAGVLLGGGGVNQLTYFLISM